MEYKSYFPSQDPMLKLRQEMKLLQLSEKTVKSYLHYISSFLTESRKSPREASTQDIRGYLEKMANCGVSASTLNTAYSALKFYFGRILHRKFFLALPRAKKVKSLPTVLSKEEVERMIGVMENKKHKCIISLLYGTGVRVGELVRIKMSSIDLDRMVLLVFRGKGMKDRVVILPNKLRETLLIQSRLKLPGDYLFTNGRGSRLTEKTIEKVVKQAAEKADIRKHVSPHTFRHTFATHLLENGTDIRYIQELLGHARLQTTQIYTKVAVNNLQKIKSPLD